MSERKFTIPKAIVNDLIANKYPGLEVETYDLGNNVTMVMFPGSIPLHGDAFRTAWEGKAGIITVVQNQKRPTETVDEACWSLWTNLRLIEREINSQSERQAEQVQDKPDIERDDKKPRIPKKPFVLNRWKIVWRTIQLNVKNGKSSHNISEWLAKTHPNLAVSEETLADIIKAGLGGYLNDTNPP